MKTYRTEQSKRSRTWVTKDSRDENQELKYWGWRKMNGWTNQRRWRTAEAERWKNGARKKNIKNQQEKNKNWWKLKHKGMKYGNTSLTLMNTEQWTEYGKTYWSLIINTKNMIKNSRDSKYTKYISTYFFCSLVYKIQKCPDSFIFLMFDHQLISDFSIFVWLIFK